MLRRTPGLFKFLFNGTIIFRREKKVRKYTYTYMRGLKKGHIALRFMFSITGRAIRNHPAENPSPRETLRP